MGEGADQLPRHEVFSGIVVGTLHGDEDRSDLLSFVAGARNLEEAQMQLLALRSFEPFRCTLAMRPSRWRRWDAALAPLPCRAGLDEERSAFRGSPAVHTAEQRGVIAVLLGMAEARSSRAAAIATTRLPQVKL